MLTCRVARDAIFGTLVPFLSSRRYIGGQVCASSANRTIQASVRECYYLEQATDAVEFLPCPAAQISSSNSPSNRPHPFFPSHAQFTKSGGCCVIRLLADTHFTVGRSQIRQGGENCRGGYICCH